MHKLHDFFSWAMFVSFFSTALAAPSANSTGVGITTKSVPTCAASPTVFTDLPFEFWIETIFLKPLKPLDILAILREDYPLQLDEDYLGLFLGEDISGSGVSIAGASQPRDLFFLDSELLRIKNGAAQIWPYVFPDDDFPGYSQLAFEVNADRPLILLDFTAVKVCSSTNATELQLRARRTDNSSGRTFYFFQLFPLSSVLLKT